MTEKEALRRAIGRLGGKASASKLTAEQRTERASKAGRAPRRTRAAQ